MIEFTRPRYKCIAEYPKAEYRVGNVILMFEHMEENYAMDEQGSYLEPESFFQKYPHLFRKLKWWESREATEPMPMYLKVGNRIHCVHVHFAGSPTLFWAFKNGEEGERELFNYNNCEIATEEDFNAQNK